MVSFIYNKSVVEAYNVINYKLKQLLVFTTYPIKLYELSILAYWLIKVILNFPSCEIMTKLSCIHMRNSVE